MNLVKDTAKQLIQKSLNLVGLRLISQKRVIPDHFERINNLNKLGFYPNTIFDCGAFVGNWTLRVSQIFSKAKYFLIEPNSLVVNRIKNNLKQVSSECVIINAALSNKVGEGILNIWENEKYPDKDTAWEASSLLSHVQGEASKQIPVDIKTLNSICSEYRVLPDLVKLDLQGNELSALQSATELFGKTEIFIVEFGCLDAYRGRTNPRELLDLMYDNNYTLYDAVGFGYRPYDNALSSGDFFFVKTDSNLRKHKDYF